MAWAWIMNLQHGEVERLFFDGVGEWMSKT